MSQHSFNMLFPEHRRLARNSDPETSHEAAQKAVRSGTVGRQCALVLDLVRAWPNSTSGELAWYSAELDRYAVSRRLADLHTKGLVEKGPSRVCRSLGSKQLTWNVMAGEATGDDGLD